MRTLWYVVPVVAVLSIVLPSLVGGAWSPTRTRVVRKMLDYAHIKPGECLIDLGAGDGRILLAATRDYGAKSIGIEIDPIRWLICKIRLALLTKPGQATVVMGNFFDFDLSQADVITFYLSQAAADKLQGKLEEELKEGTRVISYRRPITGWDVYHHDRDDDIYVYVVGPTPLEKAAAN